MDKKQITLGIALLIVEALIIIQMAAMAGYHPEANASKSHDDKLNSRFDGHNPSMLSRKHPVFQDVHVMVFIGFGFLMTFLKRYGFSAIGFNLLIASLNVQWSILCSGFFHDSHGGDKVSISVESLLSADLATAALLISFGAVLGKTTPLQLVIMGLIETALFTANEHLGLSIFKAKDAGGSIFVHAFGAYFGLAVSFALGHGKAISQGPGLEKEGSSYTSDTFAMIGTVFLWLFWPSFNSALVEGDDQHRAVINTYLSLTACCVTAFALSAIFSKDNKFNMVHIQNSTLAGGVAIGTACDMMVHPYGALIVGVAGGTISILGYHYLTPFLLKTFKVHDTCGVHNLHGMPGVLAGIVGAIVAGLASESQYGLSLYHQFPARAPPSNGSSGYDHTYEPGDGRSAGGQAGYQLLAVGVTVLLAIVGGLITGFILRVPALNKLTKEQYFDDSHFWEIPEEHHTSHITEIHQEAKRKSENDEKTVEPFNYGTDTAQ